MELRPYQRQAVDELKSNLSDNPVLVSPVGSGKSVILAALVQEFGKPSLILAHRRELVAQLAGHLERAGLTVGIIQAGIPERRHLPIQVASIQTLARREKPPADLVILDEAHHCRAETYQALFAGYPSTNRIGATATAFRLDGRGLGALFGTMVFAASTQELIDAGHLVAPTVFVPSDPDLGRVKITAGDYNLKSLAERMDRPGLVADVIEQWKKHATNRRTVVFAVNVAHSIHLRDRFISAGITSEHVDGSTPTTERKAIFARFASGSTLVLCNVGIINEGFDLPALEVMVGARPTASLCWHVQSVGRVMRACENKAGALVLDHAGNFLRHGEITRLLPHSLKESESALRESQPVSVKRCKQCFLLVQIQASECPECGYVFRSEAGIPQEHPGELEKMAPKQQIPFSVKSDAWNRLVLQQSNFHFKEGYPYARFRQMFGESPTVENGKLIDPSQATDATRRAEYLRLLAISRQKNFKPGWAAMIFKSKYKTFPPWRWQQEAGVR